MTSRVLQVRPIGVSAAVVRFTREDLAFLPGQHLKVGVKGGDLREYSVYSAAQAPYLEILVRDVDGGRVSGALCGASPGEPLEVVGPLGDFVLPRAFEQRPLLFVASGTGIAPYHCMVQSNPRLDYRLLHGIRTADDGMDAQVYDRGRYRSCVSREAGGDFHGRVTDYLQTHPVDAGTLCFLCGSCDMIYDSFAILERHGIPRDDIRVETYY